MNPHELQEPIVESAPIAHRVAQQLCTRDPHTGETCAWYHGFWQYLRAMGLAKTCGGQGPFFVDTLRALIGRDAMSRVLVSGTADYSMPAHVLFAFAGENRPLDLAVVDHCETPLYLSRWYAERRGTTIATARSDVLAYENSIPFDVVLTNSFLGYFDADARSSLVATWRRLLRSGGKAVFTNRLRPGAPAAPVGFTVEQTRHLSEAVRGEAERWRSVFAFDPDDVATWARVYGERSRFYSIRSADEIVSLLRDGGFAPDHVEIVATAASGGHSVTGPSIADAAKYVRVIATRL
jgi:SAM-dependent methyltransferase